MNIADAIKSLSDDLSPALKKMKVEYYTNVTNNCYQDKHISDSFTNVEQIELCKNEEHEAIFGKYEQNLKNYRDSDLMRLNHCQIDAGNSVPMVLDCFKAYQRNIGTTNLTLKKLFAEEYKAYL